MNTLQFGPMLRVVRTAAGVSLRALARRLEVSPAYLSQVENMKLPPPPPARLAAVAGELGVCAPCIYTLAEKAPPVLQRLVIERPEMLRIALEVSASPPHPELLPLFAAALHEVPHDELVAELRQLLERTRKAHVRATTPTLVITALSPSLVATDIAYDAWEDIIDELGDRIEQECPSVAADDVAAPLTAPPYPGQALLGGGFALAHTTVEGVPRPIAAVGVLPNRPAIGTPATPLSVVIVAIDGPRYRKRLAQLVARLLFAVRQPFVEEALSGGDARSIAAAFHAADRILG